MLQDVGRWEMPWAMEVMGLALWCVIPDHETFWVRGPGKVNLRWPEPEIRTSELGGLGSTEDSVADLVCPAGFLGLTSLWSIELSLHFLHGLSTGLVKQTLFHLRNRTSGAGQGTKPFCILAFHWCCWWEGLWVTDCLPEGESHPHVLSSLTTLLSIASTATFARFWLRPWIIIASSTIQKPLTSNFFLDQKKQRPCTLLVLSLTLSHLRTSCRVYHSFQSNSGKSNSSTRNFQWW